MAHAEQRDFVESVRRLMPWYFTGVSVLEVGSLNINGTVRDFFTDCDYLGADVAPGRDVDLVAQGQDLDFPDRHFDTVISAECLEHNPHWAETFANMVRMSSGLVVMTCATTGRGEHGTSRTSPADSPLTVGLGWDYYRNLTEDDIRTAVDVDAAFTQYGFDINDQSRDLYFWGLVRSAKGKSWPTPR